MPPLNGACDFLRSLTTKRSLLWSYNGAVPPPERLLRACNSPKNAKDIGIDTMTGRFIVKTTMFDHNNAVDSLLDLVHVYAREVTRQK
jgi:hypothetical protein